MGETIKQRPKRLRELEILRTVSFLAVVAQHVLGAYVRNPGITAPEQTAVGLLFGLTKFAVPMFVFVSGVVLFLHYYGTLQYGRFLCKRLGAILLPYLIWAGLMYVHGMVMYGAPPCGKREFLLRIVTLNVGYHTWYVGLILQFYLFLPVIFWLFGQLERLCKSQWSTFGVFFAVLTVSVVLMEFGGVLQPIPIVGKLFFDMRAKNALYYLIYFLLGGVCALHREAFLGFLRRWTVPLLAAAVVGYIWCEIVQFQRGFSGGVMNFNWMGSLNLRMTVLTLASIGLLYRLALAIMRCESLCRLCDFVGRHSYSAYLAHVMVLNTAALGFGHFFSNIPLPGFYFVLMLSTTVGAVLAGWMFDAAYGRLRCILLRKN